MKFRIRQVFCNRRSLMPKPPSCLDNKAMSQAIKQRAPEQVSFPVQKKARRLLSIASTTPWGGKLRAHKVSGEIIKHNIAENKATT